MIRTVRGGARDRGSYSLELAILAPLFIALLGIIIAAARVHLAEGAADSAARAAARSASLERSPAEAQPRAEAAARRSLQESGLRCSSVTVSIDTSGLTVPVGQAGTVEASVACTVALADIGVPGLPGAKTLRADFSSVVDVYRARDLGFANSEVPHGANRSVRAAQ